MVLGSDFELISHYWVPGISMQILSIRPVRLGMLGLDMCECELEMIHQYVASALMHLCGKNT